MTQYVYMNERIKQKKPRKPVIVVQGPDKTVVSNLFRIKVGNIVIGHIVYDRKGLDHCHTHDVQAWLEFHDQVIIEPMEALPARPVATEKKPNSQVKLEFGD